jgi:cysteine desulfurase
MDMIYLDNASTTAVHPDVKQAMEAYFSEHYGNPSSIHEYGRTARNAVDRAREQISDFLMCAQEELIFTSSGTESIHSAMLGALLASPDRKHIVVSAVEHHAVLHTSELLRDLGAEVTVVPCGTDGRIRVEDVLSQIRPNTLLVSVMAVNNELGTIQPIHQIAEAVKDVSQDILVHSDMVQALGTQTISLKTSQIDLASFTAHKIHGPKGVGLLYMRSGTPWQSVMRGGAQERYRRAGTENVPGVVGFGAAVQWLQTHFQAHIEHLRRMRQLFWEGIRDLPGVSLNSPEHAAPSILNIHVDAIRNDTLLMRLDLSGLAASAGSACNAGSLEPSHVLRAAQFPESVVRESIRFSFSALTTESDIIRSIRIFTDTLQRLRQQQRR